MSKTILKDETNQEASADVPIADPSATVAMIGEREREAACPSSQQPAHAREEEIRTLAHRKWEVAGYPAGDGFDFWLEAEREVDAERLGSSPAQE